MKQFIEKLIDGYRAAEIRKHSRTLFAEIDSKNKRLETSGGAPALIRRYFNYEMAFGFPKIQYCEHHWNAEKVATDAYPHWHSPFKKTIKQEVCETVTESWPSKKKRLRTSSMYKISKKAKITPSAPIVIIAASEPTQTSSSHQNVGYPSPASTSLGSFTAASTVFFFCLYSGTIFIITRHQCPRKFHEPECWRSAVL